MHSRLHLLFLLAVASSPTARAELRAGAAMVDVTPLTFPVLVNGNMYFINTSPERFAEHLETTNPPFGIPAGAKDICYCQGWRGTIAYEFTIDEARFRNWAEAQFADRKDSHHEENGTMRVTTYRTLLPDFHDVEQLEIPHAVIYSWAEADAGTYAVFDRDTNRVYYFSHSY